MIVIPATALPPDGVVSAMLFGLVVASSFFAAMVRAASADPQTSGLEPLINLAYRFWVLCAVASFGLAAFATIHRPEWRRHFQLASFFPFIAPATARALRLALSAWPVITCGSLLISLLRYAGATRFRDRLSGEVSQAALIVSGGQPAPTALLFFSLDGASLCRRFASALTGHPS